MQFRYTDWKGERQQKFKRGFAAKREAQEWEREFLMQKQADVTMSFDSYAELYKRGYKAPIKRKQPAADKGKQPHNKNAEIPM